MATYDYATAGFPSSPATGDFLVIGDVTYIYSAKGAWVVDSSSGGGGVWTEISSSTVSTAVSQVEFSITGYTIYKLFYYGVNWGTNDNSFAIKITVGSSGTYSETLRGVRHRFGGNNTANQHAVYGGNNYSLLEFWPGTRVESSNGSNFGEITIFNTVGQPTIKVEDCLMDDTSDVSSGITHSTGGFASPASTATIGKIKLVGSQGNNFEAGTFALYGLTIS